MSPNSRNENALKYGVVCLSNSSLLHLPGTCPNASHLKYSVNAEVSLSETAIVLLTRASLKTLKTVNDIITSITFFSAVLKPLPLFCKPYIVTSQNHKMLLYYTLYKNQNTSTNRQTPIHIIISTMRISE